MSKAEFSSCAADGITVFSYGYGDSKIRVGVKGGLGNKEAAERVIFDYLEFWWNRLSLGEGTYE